MGERYETAGIQSLIPHMIRAILWELMIKLPEPKDYLQVFRLEVDYEDDEMIQHITHIQEDPVYEATYHLSSLAPVEATIFIIKDLDYHTMLLSSEY